MKPTIGYIINESIAAPMDTKIVSESSGRVVAEAILQTAEEDNRNGRYYKREDLAREIGCARTKELLEAGMVRGECGHPMSTDLSRQQTIDPGNVIVQYLSFWMDGDNVMAQYKGTNNQLGEFIDKDLREGCKPAFSLRALGTINNKSGHAVVENLRMITYDMVIYPSHKQAYTQKLISESAGFSKGNIAENKPKLIPITNDSVISYIKSESANIKNIMNSFDTLFESVSLIHNGKDIQLIDRGGQILIVNLESYIKDEIMDYCFKR